MKISFVIPNYNGEQLLRKNLPHIISRSNDAEIVIVDDVSTDGSIIEIKNQISKIKNTKQREKAKLVQNEKNLGFASTVNQGVFEAKGELVVLLNTDVVPEGGFLKAALPHFKDSKVFAVGFLQKCLEEGKLVLRGRGIGRFSRGFLIHERGEVDKNNTLWVSGGAGIFRKEIWLTLGGMNPLYNPFYWEDIDISYRALKAGFKLVFESKSVVYHQQNIGSIKNSYTGHEIKKIAYRNQIIFVWLNITDVLYLLEHLIYLPYHLLLLSLKRDLSFLQGFVLAILRLREIFIYRRRYRKLAAKKDREILI